MSDTRQFGSASNAGTLRDRLRAAKAKQLNPSAGVTLDNAVISDDIKNQLISATGTSDSTEEDRYRAAIELARNDLRDQENVDDKLFKKTIDKYFSDLQGGEGMTGEQIRGDDGFIAKAKEGIDWFNNDILGEGGNFLWDNSLAKLINTLYPNANAEDWVNKEDVGAIASMGEDLALTLGLGPAGIALAAGKNAIQNSDSLAKAITGQDNITGEEIEGGQQAAALGSFLLNTGLSAVPGIGRLGNAMRFGAEAAEGAVKKSAGQTVKDAFGRYGESVTTGGRMAKDELRNLGRQGSIRRAGKHALGGITGGRGTLSEMERQAIMRSQGKTSVAKELKPGTHPEVAAEINAARAAKAAKAAKKGKSAEDVAKIASGTAENAVTDGIGKLRGGAGLLGRMAKGTVNAASAAPLSLFAQGLGDSAQNGTALDQAMFNAITGDNGGNFLSATALPILLRRGYRKLPNVSGTSQIRTPSIRLPYKAASAAAYGQVSDNDHETETNLGNKGMTPEEILADLLEYYGG